MKKYIVAIAVAFTVNLSAFANVPELVNGSFETSNLNTSYRGFLYNQSFGGGLGPETISAQGWSFSDWSGLSQSNTAWGGIAEDGNVFAFLQTVNTSSNVTPSISQSFTSTDAGPFSFSFALEQRSTFWDGQQSVPFRFGDPQTVSVSLDGQTIWSGTPTDVWGSYTTAQMDILAGVHTLTFFGSTQYWDPYTYAHIDTTAFVDNVRINHVSTVPEPGSLSLLLSGMGLLGFVKYKRRARHQS